jgi:hypothetical protein
MSLTSAAATKFPKRRLRMNVRRYGGKDVKVGNGMERKATRCINAAQRGLGD